MGVNIGSNFHHTVDLLDLDGFPTTYTVKGIPTTYTLNHKDIPNTYTLDTNHNGIPDTYHIDVTNLPKIQLSVDPLEIKPIDFTLKIKEIPSVRGHIPADFCMGFSLFGIEIAKLRLCGEAQVITEPYVPNRCELCGPLRAQSIPDAQTQDHLSSHINSKGNESG